MTLAHVHVQVETRIVETISAFRDTGVPFWKLFLWQWTMNFGTRRKELLAAIPIWRYVIQLTLYNPVASLSCTQFYRTPLPQ